MLLKKLPLSIARAQEGRNTIVDSPGTKMKTTIIKQKRQAKKK